MFTQSQVIYSLSSKLANGCLISSTDTIDNLGTKITKKCLFLAFLIKNKGCSNPPYAILYSTRKLERPRLMLNNLDTLWLEILVLAVVLIFLAGIIGVYVYKKIRHLPTGECSCCHKSKKKLLEEYHKCCCKNK